MCAHYPPVSTMIFSSSTCSWHLFQVIQSLGLHYNISDSAIESLHLNYSAQLAAEGIWQWACFVALHIENPSRSAKLKIFENKLSYQNCLNLSTYVPMCIHTSFMFSFFMMLKNDNL